MFGLSFLSLENLSELIRCISLILTLAFVNSFAQNHKYFYEYKYVPNINKKDSVITEMMVLDVKKTGSSYLSHDKYLADSLRMAEIEEQINKGGTNFNFKNSNILTSGMALLAMCFNLMQEEVIHKIRMFGKKIGIIIDCDDDSFMGDYT